MPDYIIINSSACKLRGYLAALNSTLWHAIRDKSKLVHVYQYNRVRSGDKSTILLQFQPTNGKFRTDAKPCASQPELHFSRRSVETVKADVPAYQ